MKKLNVLTNSIKQMINDERGVTVSSESLILIVGTSIVASVVIGAITVMLTGDNKDGTGGITKNVTDNVDKIMEQMLPVKP